MSRTIGPLFYDFVDSLASWKLLLGALALTLVPAVIYWHLSNDDGLNGLKGEGSETITFATALYFSVVTEATLGYGDIRPLGTSRGIACIQVLSGLILAGLSIAKLASRGNRSIRIAGRRADGTWLVMNELQDGRRLVTVTNIRLRENTIDYFGSNYKLDGSFCGTFESDLLEATDHELRFFFNNRKSITDYFCEGISSLQFQSRKTSRFWDYYTATAQDFGKQAQVTFRGYRATSDQEKKLLGGEVKPQREVILEFVRTFALEDSGV